MRPDCDKDTLSQAREALQRDAALLRRWEAECEERGDQEQARGWSRVAWWIEYRLLGDGDGCVIRPFDARWLDDDFRAAHGAAVNYDELRFTSDQARTFMERPCNK